MTLSQNETADYVLKIDQIPNRVADEMKKYSWNAACPVPLNQLAYLKLSHWGYDQKYHCGELIVHESVAVEVGEIFRTLFDSRFPIEKMRLIDVYCGKDDASMAANNSSAFNCRNVLGKKNIPSRHSYGKAIDINPLFNPYVHGSFVAPEAGREYLDRTIVGPGMIAKDDIVCRTFQKFGWVWGGSWTSIQDYHHFEKE